MTIDKKKSIVKESELLTVRKYLAYSGVCSRRKATEMVQQGLVKVNDKVVTEPSHIVLPTDTVTVKNKKVVIERKVYLLLNKPIDYITTKSDERGRKTVMDLVSGAVKQRIYPVGRLDRNTTGLLFFTNDGELTQRLAHPRYEVQKTYVAVLDKQIESSDLQKIRDGLILKDGKVTVDDVRYVIGKRKATVKIVLHSGKNRIVRRIFQHLGYKVVKLDRIAYAGFVKKGLPIGRWRFLKREEIEMLKKYTSN